MYLGYQNDKIISYTEQPLDKEIYNLDKIEQTDLEYVLDGECYVLKDEAWEAKKEQEEKERIAKLYMTRSDFFDGTIKALGLDSNELLVLIEQVLSTLALTDTDKKVAINNYKNALNFYRSHPLFSMLSNIPLPLVDGKVLIITSSQWDNFFNLTALGDEYAYLSLIPTELPIEE